MGKKLVLCWFLAHILPTQSPLFLCTAIGIQHQILIFKIFTASIDLVKQKLRLSCTWLTGLFSVDAIRGLEYIKQRFKRSATVGEVEDVGTGRQLLEMGILLAFLAALPAAMFVYVAMTFICAGGVACGNPLETLLFGHPV